MIQSTQNRYVIALFMVAVSNQVSARESLAEVSARVNVNKTEITGVQIINKEMADKIVFLEKVVESLTPPVLGELVPRSLLDSTPPLVDAFLFGELIDTVSFDLVVDSAQHGVQHTEVSCGVFGWRLAINGIPPVALEANHDLQLFHGIDTARLHDPIFHTYPKSTADDAPWRSIGLVHSFTLSHDACTVNGYDDGDTSYSYTHTGPASFTYTFSGTPI